MVGPTGGKLGGLNLVLGGDNPGGSTGLATDLLTGGCGGGGAR